MESIKELRKLCQEKGYREHNSIRIYRIFSIYFTKFFLILGLKSNTITLLSFLAGIFGGILFIKSSFILGGIFFFIFYLFDNIDGEIARYRHSSSQFGYWLDTTIGHFLYPVFFLTVGVGIFNQTSEVLYLFLGSISAISKLLERSVFQPKSTKEKKSVKTKIAKIFSIKMWISYVAKYPIIIIFVLLFAIFSQMKLFLILYSPFLLLLASGKIILIGFRTYKSNC
jgi:phosphatidylglycerophosphate synthase